MKKLTQFAEIIGVAIYAALFFVFIIQVISRFIFNHPMAWTDELVVVLYIWVVMWCAAFVCRDREHVMFDLLYNTVSPTVQRVMRIVGALALAGILGYALMGNWDYVWFMRREKTPVLGIPFFWVFVPFILFLLSLIVRSLWSVGRDVTQKESV